MDVYEQPAATSQGDDRLWRALAVFLFLALAFGCAVMIIAMADIAGTPTCHDIVTGKAAIPADGQCFSASSFQKTVSLVLGFAGGGIAGLASLLALAFVITGRRGRLTLLVTAVAVVLAGLGILIGSV
jgi:hypothetical protein